MTGDVVTDGRDGGEVCSGRICDVPVQVAPPRQGRTRVTVAGRDTPLVQRDQGFQLDLLTGLRPNRGDLHGPWERCRNRAAAICERPEFPVHTNNANG